MADQILRKVNAAQVHLMFNHWPLILIAVAFFLLLFGERGQNLTLKQWGLWLFVIAALFTIPSQFSGEGAELIIEGLRDVDHELVEKHETLGFFSSMLAYGLGILSFISIIMIHSTNSIYGAIRKLIIVGAAIGFVLMMLTAHSGGAISHPEIRSAISSSSWLFFT